MGKTTLQRFRLGGFPAQAFVALRRIALSMAVLAPGVGHAGAQERNRIDVETKYYEIAGKTPQELFTSMLKRGPKDGFYSRALAQTKYHTEWRTSVKYADGKCRVVDATADALITYIYPRAPANLPKAVNRRWTTFISGLMRHERQHGKYVRQMLVQARKSVVGLQLADGEKCRKTRAEMKRRVRTAHDDYEARQVAFDEREHSDGGAIDRLIVAFVRPL